MTLICPMLLILFLPGSKDYSGKSHPRQDDICVSQEWVSTLFKILKIGKAAVPEAIYGPRLCDCADQLSEVFSTQFQISAVSGQITTLWKTTTVIHILKLEISKLI